MAKSCFRRRRRRAEVRGTGGLARRVEEETCGDELPSPGGTALLLPLESSVEEASMDAAVLLTTSPCRRLFLDRDSNAREEKGRRKSRRRRDGRRDHATDEERITPDRVGVRFGKQNQNREWIGKEIEVDQKRITSCPFVTCLVRKV